MSFEALSSLERAGVVLEGHCRSACSTSWPCSWPNLAPIFLVATAAKIDAAPSAAIIQAGLLVAGLGTCLQLYGVSLIRSRLPMVTGISFTYVAAAMSIAQHQGYGAVAGAVVLGGLLEVVLGLTAKCWRRFVPPIVSADSRHLDWHFAPVRRRHELRRRFRREGFRQLAESDAWPDFAGGLPCVPAARSKGTAKQLSVLFGLVVGAMWSDDFHRKGRFLRFRQSAGRVGAAFHAVQARV